MLADKILYAFDNWGLDNRRLLHQFEIENWYIIEDLNKN